MRRLCDPEIMWVANQFVSLKWRLSYWILELWNTLTKPWSPTIPHRFWNFKSDIKGGSKDCLVFFTALICHLCSLEVWTERVRSCLWSLSCERGKYSWCQHCMEVVLGFEVWYLRNGRQAKLGGPSTTDNYVIISTIAVERLLGVKTYWGVLRWMPHVGWATAEDSHKWWWTTFSRVALSVYN